VAVQVDPRRNVTVGLLENTRDLGGYESVDGRRIRWRRLFRAASLHEVDATDATSAAEWRALCLRTVVDLRREDERATRGVVSRDLQPVGEVHLPAHLVPFYPELDMDLEPEEFLAACYEDILVHGRDTVRSVFRLLADEDNLPLVLFCAAGKDRTGTMVALILAALGVARDTICDDYELSGERVAAMVRRKRASGAERDPMIDQHPTILRAPRGAMRLFLQRLSDETGGIERFLAEIGIDSETLDRVRDALLESPEASLSSR
jgi:protein-tyrosine phosphatase